MFWYNEILNKSAISLNIQGSTKALKNEHFCTFEEHFCNHMLYAPHHIYTAFTQPP